MSKKQKNGLCHPVFFVAIFLAILSLFLHILSANSPAVADFIITRIAPVFRAILAYLTAIFPFSLAEWLLLFSPLWLFLLLRLARRAARDKRRSWRMLTAVLSVPLLLYSGFVFTLGTGYYGTPLADKLGLPQHEPDGQTLYELTSYLSSHAEQEAQAAGVSVAREGSVSPLTHKQINLLLLSAYDSLSVEYPFISNFQVGTKEVALSVPMAYTHITGVYSFFTGESNVCTAYPDYSVIFTAAHEMAHARGIAREDEANFMAYLACTRADHPYIRYAGYLNLMQYVSNALYDADRALFKQAWQEHSDIVVAELLAYNEVLHSFSGSIASDVAGSINDAYLEGMGTGGSISYDRVVLLAVRYFAR